jgi:hypothetical protein
MVKGWLDPRTQDKIEFVPVGDTLKRLQEFISPEFIPVSYGGTGPEFHLPKLNTDFVQVRSNRVYYSIVRCALPYTLPNLTIRFPGEVFLHNLCIWDHRKN